MTASFGFGFATPKFKNNRINREKMYAAGNLPNTLYGNPPNLFDGEFIPAPIYSFLSDKCGIPGTEFTLSPRVSS